MPFFIDVMLDLNFSETVKIYKNFTAIMNINFVIHFSLFLKVLHLSKLHETLLH